jgi:spermidine synthase
MFDAQEALRQPAPFVLDTLTSRALQFSLGDIQSQMRLDDPDALELDYTRLMMGFLLFAPAPARLAMIGLGGGSLAKFCFRHVPCADIDVVEINSQVIDLRDHFHVPPDGARFRVLQADGARFVRKQAGTVDVLIVDGFDDQGQPDRLASQAFYDDCLGCLAADGVMVVNLHTGHQCHAVHVDRIRLSFDDRLLLVESEEDGNTIAFAFKDSTPLARRGAARSRPAPLGEGAAASLHAAFASIERALEESRS